MNDNKSLADIAAMAGSVIRPTQITSGLKKPQLAVISKLTKSFDQSEKRIAEIMEKGGMLGSELKTMAERAAVDQTDAQTIMDTLPDLMMGAELQIGMIVNPKDTGSPGIRIAAEAIDVPELAVATLNAVAERMADTELDINRKLPVWLLDILYLHGSKTVVVIPENAVDDVINGKMSTEAFDKLQQGLSNSIEFLRPPEDPKTMYSEESMKKRVDSRGQEVFDARLAYRDGKISSDYINRVINKANYGTETYSTDRAIYFENKASSISYYDDPRILTLNTLSEMERDLATRTAYKVESVSLEDFGNPEVMKKKKRLTAAGVIDAFYRAPETRRVNLVRVKTRDALNRPSVGEPILRELPACSVFPVTLPSNPTKRIGIFVALGHNSEPITEEEVTQAFDASSGVNSQFGTSSHSTIQAIDTAMHDPGQRQKNQNEHFMRKQAFAQALEEQLLGALERGILGDRFELKYSDEIMSVMFFRHLRNMRTSLVFIPEQYVVYMAHRFDRSGRGISFIQAMRNIISARCAIVFANMMSALRNAVPNLDVKVKLDEDDPNPIGSLSLASAAITRMRGDYSTLGIFSPDVILDKLGRSGIRLVWEGHKDLPDINVEYSDSQASIGKPDAETEKMFADLTAQGQGLSPDLLDNARGPDFAIQVAVSATLRSRRVEVEQTKVNGYLTDLLRKFFSHSPRAFKELRDSLKPLVKGLRSALVAKEIISDNDKTSDDGICALVAVMYIGEMHVELPKPDSTTNKNKTEMIGEQSNYLDAVLPYVIDSSLLTSNNFGPASATIEELKAVTKASLMREWMAANNIGTEVLNLVNVSEDGRSMYDLRGKTDTYVLGLIKTLIPYLVGSRKMEKGIQDLVEKYNIDVGGSTSSSSDDTSTDDTNDNDDGSNEDDIFGGFPDTGDGGGDTTEPEPTNTDAADKAQGKIDSGEVADTNALNDNDKTPSKDDDVAQ